ncbi:cupin domain-containing protein [Halomonas sp. TRM85114]|uniref:cupin domain-containing protein n=1 Tax=Halomonas jincaotanensis TaxID=2810616 RepID=UPI001BD5504B|nr:cupin domain-containing protein [Halomonas jincaotanensis]MBS9405350.1 cupin domain-containing protein [Halomonas jincaotanensis]
MIHIRKLVGSATLFVALIVSASVEANEPKPIAAEPLTQRHDFDGNVSVKITQNLEGLPEQAISFDDASHLTVVRFTIQPGAVFPWHTHPGTVLITVTEGEFVFIFAEDCLDREYGPGDALVDPGDTVHTALNPSRNEETVVVAVLLGAPAEGALTIPVNEKRNAALDAECGIERNGA